MKIIPSVVLQHAEDVSHLWNVRASAVNSPAFTLAELARLDARLEANLDGMEIAIEEGWRLFKEEVGWKTPGDLFCAACLSLGGEKPRPQQWAEVLAAVTDEPELSRGVVSALGWMPFAQVEPHLSLLLADSSPLFQRVGIAAMACHRRDPGINLRRALTSDDPKLRARALKGAGELGRIDLLPLVAEHLGTSDLNSRFWAAWTHALLSSDSKPVSVLRVIAESLHPRREQALQAAFTRMPEPARRAWTNALKQNPATSKLACHAVGMLGDVESIPWLINQMHSTSVGRIAGDAFTRITGINLALHNLERGPPEEIPSGPTDNPKDEDVAMDIERDLSWPDPQKVETWWAEHQSEFLAGKTYFCGKPIPDGLDDVLATGHQRYRSAAAFMFAAGHPGRPLFNTAAPASRQFSNLK